MSQKDKIIEKYYDILIQVYELLKKGEYFPVYKFCIKNKVRQDFLLRLEQLKIIEHISGDKNKVYKWITEYPNVELAKEVREYIRQERAHKKKKRKRHTAPTPQQIADKHAQVAKRKKKYEWQAIKDIPIDRLCSTLKENCTPLKVQEKVKMNNFLPSKPKKKISILWGLLKFEF